MFSYAHFHLDGGGGDFKNLCLIFFYFNSLRYPNFLARRIHVKIRIHLEIQLKTASLNCFKKLKAEHIVILRAVPRQTILQKFLPMCLCFANEYATLH